MSSGPVFVILGAPTPRAASVLGLDDTYTGAGHVWDAAVVQYFARARWLDPAAGRCTGEDP